MHVRHVTLLPIAGVPGDEVKNLAQDLSRAGFSVLLVHQRPVPAEAYDRKRHQYRADVLMDFARREADGRTLVVTDLDLYAGTLNFVFGLADPSGKAAVISLHRLRLGADDRLLRQRALKEAVHELGHTEGLQHCTAPGCVMQSSNSLVESDRKGSVLCDRCKQRIAS